jgi:type IV secretion system protein VirB11
MRLTPGRVIMTELRDDAAWDYPKALVPAIQAVLCRRTLIFAHAFDRIGLPSRRPRIAFAR